MINPAEILWTGPNARCCYPAAVIKTDIMPCTGSVAKYWKNGVPVNLTDGMLSNIPERLHRAPGMAS